MLVSEQIAQAIASTGVATVFSLAGEAHMRIIKAIEDTGLNVIGTRTENGTIGAADGYARIAGVAGVALVNTSQGLPNGVPAVLTAMEAATPLVVLAAKPPAAALTYPASVAAVASRTVHGSCKEILSINTPEQVRPTLEAAFALARSGRPGPVVVEVVTDILAREAPEVALEPADTEGPGLPGAALEAAAELLKGRRRVVAVVGPEVRWSTDLDGVRQLCLEHGLVVLGDGLGRGLVDELDGSSVPIRLAIDLCAEADAVVLIGAEAGTSTGLGNPRFFADDVALVRITADAASPFQMQDPHTTLVGDCGELSRALSALLVAAGFGQDADFGTTVRDRVAERVAGLQAAATEDAASPLCPGALASAVREAAPEDAVHISDGAVIHSWAQGLVQVGTYPGWMDHSPFGSMGMGTPLALGAAAAAKDEAHRTGDAPRPVYLITGDGAAGYFLAEWGVAVQYDLALTVLVSNDSGWGTERLKQIEVLGGRYNVDFHDVRYDVIAQGLGCDAVRATTLSELRLALTEPAGAQLVIDVVTEGVGPRPSVPRFFPGGRHGENDAKQG